MQTVIWRHRRENLKKCSLRGLEGRSGIAFFTYPSDGLPDLSSYVCLSLDGPELSIDDADRGLLLVDGTWRYAEKMLAQLPPMEKRSIPPNFVTAYPRKQDHERGLASIEALYVAYTILERDTGGMLNDYHWRDLFFDRNGFSG